MMPDSKPNAALDQSPEPDPRVRRVELIISALLRGGVLLSLAFVALGTILTFAHHPNYLHSRDEYRRLISEQADFPHTLGAVFSGAGEMRGRAIVMIGLLILIATPVMRVAVSVFAFAYQRDRIFVAITLVVLTLLIVSFILGETVG